ncbi:Inner membrane permease ygbN [Pantoea agglomerans]|uniref:Inner membrane permease ygbN n=1 Tax=Enterobacter agglomerans TaxID=549 RepID=A0A379ADT1_ENTAG|nr:Inner membrane permease ygbN [Pantoea agglomerans]
MSTALLLAIATASIVILLLLVIKAKVHPFVALLIVSLLVAIATGIPAEKIMETIITGMGGLLGHITIIIVLGAMLGRSLKPRAVPSRWRSVSVKRWG